MMTLIKMRKIYQGFLILWVSSALGGMIHACTVETTPKDSHSLYNQGLIQLQQKNPQGAIDYFDQAIKVDRNYAEAYINRGIVYDELGKSQQAIADYNQAISINRNLAEVYYNRGNTYSRLNNLTAAITDYTQAIRINSQYTYAYANRGVSYYSLGKKQEALQDLQKAGRLFEEKGDQLNRQRILTQIDKFQRE
jgi:tetratricopeptide (TPR) repeat protein